MGSLTDTYENAVLDAIAGSGRAAGFPATFYLALFTTDPGEAGGGVEVTGGAYARQAITNDTTNWPLAAGSSKSNAVAKSFPAATANWGTVTYAALMTALAAGAMVCRGSVSPTPINTGETATFPAGSLVFTAD